MIQDEYIKLAEKIDKGFAQTEKRLSEHDKSFEKFFKYMENRFSVIEKNLENTATKKQVNDLSGAVAELGANVKDYHVELLLMGKKVDRLEQVILHIAQETGVKLKFDF